LGYHGYETASQGAETPVILAVEDIVMEEKGKWFEYGHQVKCEFSDEVGLIERLWNYCESVGQTI
jgi:hypothetical protein